MGHQNDIERDGLAGNQQVIRTDASPLFFKLLTDTRRRPGGLLVEWNQDQGGKEEFHPRPFPARKTTSLDAGIKFKPRHRGNAQVGRPMGSHALQGSRVAAQDGDAGLRIEKMGQGLSRRTTGSRP